MTFTHVCLAYACVFYLFKTGYRLIIIQNVFRATNNLSSTDMGLIYWTGVSPCTINVDRMRFFLAEPMIMHDDASSQCGVVYVVYRFLFFVHPCAKERRSNPVGFLCRANDRARFFVCGGCGHMGLMPANGDVLGNRVKLYWVYTIHALVRCGFWTCCGQHQCLISTSYMPTLNVSDKHLSCLHAP